MGEVYLAQDTGPLDRKVALKFPSQEMQQDPVARQRFLREARSAAALDGPYVCHIHEVGTDLGELMDEIGDSRLPTEGAVTGPSQVRAEVTEGSWRQLAPWGVASLMTVALLISPVVPRHAVRSVEPTTPLRLHVQLPRDQSLNTTNGGAAILSPDGKRIAYVAGAGQNTQLYVRALDQLEPIALTGTEGAQVPFFSPDGQWVGFSAGYKLKKISVTGGAVRTLCDLPGDSGASWGPDDTIIFALPGAGLFRVAATGGTYERLTFPGREEGENSHHHPQFLPGGNWVLFSAGSFGSFDEANIIAQSLETGERKVLHRGGYYPRYVPTGHLVFVRGATLFASPFDVDHLEVTGLPAPVLEDLSSNLVYGDAQFAFSRSGTLLYLWGAEALGRRQLVWMNREGREEPVGVEPRPYGSPRLSPDGRRLAVTIGDPNVDVWIYDLERKTLNRLTSDPAFDYAPVWTPDGQQVVFTSTRDEGPGSLFSKVADGTGQVERLTTSRGGSQLPYSFSPDGLRLLFKEYKEYVTSWDIGVLSMEGERSSETLVGTQFTERHAALSPDGRWMAYMSDESGRFEVYVRPFPNVEDGKFTISRDGGQEPLWGPQGRELVYLENDDQTMMVVPIQTEPTFRAGTAEALFKGLQGPQDNIGGGRRYDISPDGQRFLMIKDAEQRAETGTELIIVLNWFDELKRLVPTDN